MFGHFEVTSSLCWPPRCCADLLLTGCPAEVRASTHDSAVVFESGALRLGCSKDLLNSHWQLLSWKQLLRLAPEWRLQRPGSAPLGGSAPSGGPESEPRLAARRSGPGGPAGRGPGPTSPCYGAARGQGSESHPCRRAAASPGDLKWGSSSSFRTPACAGVPTAQAQAGGTAILASTSGTTQAEHYDAV